jgi:hypothetical protein
MSKVVTYLLLFPLAVLMSCEQVEKDPLHQRIDEVIGELVGDIRPQVFELRDLEEKHVSYTGIIDSTAFAGSGRFLSSVAGVLVVDSFVYVSDAMQHTIFRFDIDLNFIDTVGREGKGPGEFTIPGDIVRTEDKIYVDDTGGLRVNVYDSQFEFQQTIELGQSIPMFYRSLASGYNLLIKSDYRVGNNEILNIYNTTDKPYVLKSMMKPLVFPGEHPRSLNALEFHMNWSNNIVTAYVGLPYIFVFNPEFELTHFLAIKTWSNAGEEIDPFVELKYGIQNIRSIITSIVMDNEKNVYLSKSNNLFIFRYTNNTYSLDRKVVLGTNHNKFSPSRIFLSEDRLFMIFQGDRSTLFSYLLEDILD